MFRTFWMAFLCAFGLCLPAQGQQCFPFADDSDLSILTLSEVSKGAKRVYFSEPDCDVGSKGEDGCRSKAFVVPGDLVLIDQVFDSQACAAFVNRKGKATYGLLPNDMLQAPKEPMPDNATAFLGRFVRIEAEMTVAEATEPGQLLFTGAATFGALDPERPEGSVNQGSVEFLASPEGTVLPFSNVSPDAQGNVIAVRPPNEGEDYDCRLTMAVYGPYLAVRDNRNCGGMNVSFTGLYRRQ